MTTPTAATGFFIVEASALIDGLDTLFDSGGADGPDAEAFVRLARALRGNSTMYRQTEISRVAGAVERAARALRERAIPWNPRLRAALVAAVDDLRILVRNVAAWSSADDQRALARATELESLVPESSGAPARNAAGMGRAFLATQASELVAALDRVAASSDDRSALAALLRHSRSLRGVALLKEQPVLAHVVSTIERIAQAAEYSDATVPPERAEIFRSAAVLLAHAAAEISEGRTVASVGSEADAFAIAVGSMAPSESVVAPVVPVESLAFDDDAQHVISAASSPPFTLAARFRAEVVTFAEHLRRVIADAADAIDAPGRNRAVREIQTALRGVIATAESFSERELARRLSPWLNALGSLNPGSLATLDSVAKMLADPATSGAAVSARLQPPARTGIAAPVDRVAVAATSPLPVAGSQRQASSTPTGADLRAHLRNGISGIALLDQQPLSARAQLPLENVVPIDTLLYSGRHALARAVELRDQIRSHGGGASDDRLTELFDLLDLALVE